MSSWFASVSGLHGPSPLPLAIGHIKRAQLNVIRFSKLKCTFSFLPATDPFPPERPQNISAENQTVSADGRVSVLLRWDPPREGDLQLHHYKVTWSGPSGKESSRVADGVRLPQCSSYLISLRSQALLYNSGFERWTYFSVSPSLLAGRRFFALNISFVSGKCVLEKNEGEQSCQSPMRSCEVL